MKIANATRFFGFCIGIAATIARASSPAPAPNATPNLNLLTNGTVSAIASYPTGGVIIGGSFTMVGGTARNNLAKIKSDGTLDTTWQADTDGVVTAIVVSGDGTTFVAGSYSHIAGAALLGLSKLSAAGVPNATWVPNPNNGLVNVMEAYGGYLYIGGSFGTVGGVAHNCVARVSMSGAGAVDTWNPNVVGNIVNGLVVDAGTFAVYVGGSFNHAGGLVRSNLAKIGIDANATVDSTWDFPANSSVSALGLDAEIQPITGPVSYLYVSGSFSTLGGQARGHLGKIAVNDNILDATWKPSINGSAFAINASSSRVMLLGQFSSVTGTGGATTLHNIAMVDTNAGDLLTSGQLDADDSARAVAYDPTGMVYYFGGQFRHINSFINNGLYAAYSSLATATSPSVQAPGYVYAIATANDGSKYIGGRFTLAGGNPRTNLLKLTPSGTLDGSFAPPISDNDILALCLNPADTALYIGGSFQSMSMTFRPNLAAVSASSGALISAFEPSPDSPVTALAVDSSGSLYVGGSFLHIDGSAHTPPAQLSATGHLTNWDAGLTGDVDAFAVDTSGYIYIGGFMDNGTLSNLVKASTSDGTLVSTFHPAPDNEVYALSLDANGLLYAGGRFGTIGGQAIPGVAQIAASLGIVNNQWHPLIGSPIVTAVLADGFDRVFVGGNFYQSQSSIANKNLIKVSEAHGSIDTSWHPQPNAIVNAITEDFGTGNAAITVGGDFNSVGGIARNGLASLAPPPSDRIFADTFE